jgi:hypothetical protein
MTFDEWIAAYRIDGRKIAWSRTYSDVEMRRIARDAWNAQPAVINDELARLRQRLAELEARLAGQE